MHKLTSLMLALVALGALAGAQVQDRPDLQLKAAVYKETVEGDLQGAIALYKQIISNGAAARPVTAAALLGLGGCYEKLGEEQARGTYERLIAEYPDQAQQVTQARDRLAAISRTARASSQEPRFRRVAMATGLGGYAHAQLSPDGKELAFTDHGVVWVVPVASRADPNSTGIPTKLTGSLNAVGVGWSPDGPSIVFDTPTGISLVARSGGAPREIFTLADRGNDRRMSRISVSPDGTRLAFSRGGSLPEARVYLAGTGGATPTELPGGAGGSMPAFSPDGKRLAFVHASKPVQPPGSMRTFNGEIWIAALEGSDPVMASGLPGWPEWPVWSPDGSMLAFLQTPSPEESGHPDLRVLTITAQGRPVGTPARIRLPSETYGLLAGWTADNKIGLLRYNPEQQAIYRVPATGGRAAQISTKGWASHPRWSRDGRRIFLRWGKGQIGWMPSEGGAVTVIPVDTAVMKFEALPGGGNSISPDGATIVFSGGRQSGDNWLTDIWTIGIEGGQPKQLTNSKDPDTRFPCWSPDGQAIAFVARDPARSAAASAGKPDSLFYQVLVMSPDGTGLRQVTSEAHRVDWSAVAWSPDGKWIAFFSRDKTLNLIPAEGGDSRVVADLRRIDSLLTPGLGGLAHSEIAWSPDGKELAFSFDGRLWTVGVGGGAVTEVRTGLTGVDAIYLDWSPDGRTIAFTGSEGGDEELWLMEDFLHLVKATPPQKGRK